jgi:hypothetical protein
MNHFEAYGGDVDTVLKYYKPNVMSTWPFFPIVVPLKGGDGPATDEECDEITWEVWDHYCESYGSFKYLHEAVDLAMTMNEDLFNGAP